MRDSPLEIAWRALQHCRIYENFHGAFQDGVGWVMSKCINNENFILGELRLCCCGKLRIQMDRGDHLIISRFIRNYVENYYKEFSLHPAMQWIMKTNSSGLSRAFPKRTRAASPNSFSSAPTIFIRNITIVWKFTINQCLWLFNLRDKKRNLHGNVTNCCCVCWEMGSGGASTPWLYMTQAARLIMSENGFQFIRLPYINYFEWNLAWFSFIRC